MGITKTLPIEATEHIKELGHRLRLARIRRGMSIAEVAAKAGINRNTLNALELGKPGVALGAYITVLWVLGLIAVGTFVTAAQRTWWISARLRAKDRPGG